MKKRWPIAVVLILLLAALVVWLEPTRVVWGTLRGEAFYQGRPTSYWARAVERWHDACERCLFGSAYTSLADQALTLVGLDDPMPPRPAVLEHDPACVPVLVELLDSERPAVRYFAVEHLGALECWGPEVTAPPLRAALGHRAPEVRWRAAVLLVNGQDRDAARAIPVLLEAAQQGDAGQRRQAVEALEKLGPSAQAALPLLRSLQQRGSERELRAAAEKAILAINPATAANAGNR